MASLTSWAGIITNIFEITVNSIPKSNKPLYLYKYLLSLQSGFTK